MSHAVHEAGRCREYKALSHLEAYRSQSGYSLPVTSFAVKPIAGIDRHWSDPG